MYHNSYYNDHPSSKQMRYIRAIELYAEEEFDGDTMGEASEYINRNKHFYEEGRKVIDLKTKLQEKQAEEELLQKLLQDSTPQDPAEMYPLARSMHRHFVLHYGPTNSGKTYMALEALKNANRGLYVGPLRLLALEVSEKFNDQGVACSLITGEEENIVPNAHITASTIEMLSTKEQYDVVVIDEAQMLQDQDRGANWTTAILGTCAKEIHVCMAPEAVNLVQTLISTCGDTCELISHSRSTELIFEGKYDNEIKRGDAYIVFSRKQVLSLAAEFESNGYAVSVIYGNLPPSARREEARRFVEGETEVLISTDAIGMGLNLPIKRIVFMETSKFDGTTHRNLTVPEIKQIAGRAGRQGIFEEGFVAVKGDIKLIKNALITESKNIEKATIGIPEPAFMLPYDPKKILSRWKKIEVPDLYKKTDISNLISLCDNVPCNLNECPREILYKFLTCSIDIKNTILLNDWKRYFSDHLNGKIFNHPQISNSNSLEDLETNYKQWDLYFQICKKFKQLINADKINSIKLEISKKINNVLKENKKKFGKRCNCCNCNLPYNYRYGLCEDCYEKQRMEYHFF